MPRNNFLTFLWFSLVTSHCVGISHYHQPEILNGNIIVKIDSNLQKEIVEKGNRLFSKAIFSYPLLKLVSTVWLLLSLSFNLSYSVRFLTLPSNHGETSCILKTKISLHCVPSNFFSPSKPIFFLYWKHDDIPFHLIVLMKLIHVIVYKGK